MKVKIGAIKEVSLIDVLFHPSFVIWFSGCNFRCPWCHNGPLVFGNGEFVNVDKIIERINNVKNFIDFVHITGGEPTLQRDALTHLFKEVKNLGLKTSLNTNGSNPEVIEKLIRKRILDHIAIDVKAPLNNDSYSKVTGVKFEVKKIENSLRACEALDFIEIRTTLVPGMLSKEDVINIASSLKDFFNDFYYVIQQFNPAETVVEKKFSHMEATSYDDLIEFAKTVKNIGIKNVFIRSKFGVKSV